MKVPINSLREPTSVIRPINQFEQLLMEESMQEFGLLTPLVVCIKETGGDIIVDGYRRWLVARGLGWTEIDINPVEGDPDQLRVVCQTRQTDFGVTEKKVLVAQYLERNPDATAAEIGKAFQWAPAEVEKLCCIGYLIPEVRAMFDNEEITLVTAWALGRLLDEAQLQMIDEHGCPTLEQVEEHIRVVKHSRRRAMTSRPRVKSYNKMVKEAEHPVYAGPELIACDAKTPLDGWVAALKWASSGK